MNAQLCQAVAKRQMVSLNNAEGAMRKALPPVTCSTGEKDTQITWRALVSRFITGCWKILHVVKKMRSLAES